MKLLWQRSRAFHNGAQRLSNYRPNYKYKSLKIGNRHPPYPNIDKDHNSPLTIDTSKKAWAELVTEEKAPSWVKIHTAEPTHAPRKFPVLFLRDSCVCSACVDPNSTQKYFSTTQIPDDIKVKTLECTEDGLNITWENDIPGFEDHVTHVPRRLLHTYLSSSNVRSSLYSWTTPVLWSKQEAESLQHIQYDEYMKDDELLFKAIRQLNDYGLLFLRGVPEDEKSVEHIANRIGNLRDTFYGRTWNVKSVPQAKNVAYTKQYLGLHMDLLYMTNPPGFQFLHCLKNSASGGSALFSDSFKAFNSLSTKQMNSLGRFRLGFHYNNDGFHYAKMVPFVEKLSVIEPYSGSNIRAINYSPPFQSTLPIAPTRPDLQEAYPDAIEALKAFTEQTENKENMFEYRYQEGDCVIFNNRRVLHGRNEFDPETGERWLKGCYIDADVFTSKLRVLHAKYEPWDQKEVVGADAVVE